MIAVLSVFPILPASALATIYYVNASTGNNSNDCLDPGTACATIQAAIDKAQAGDTVSVAAGTYIEDLVLNVAITLSGPNAGVAAGPGPTLPSRASEAVIQAVTAFGAKVSVSGVTVDGLKFVRTSGVGAASDFAALSNSLDGLQTTVRNSIFDLAVLGGVTRACGSAISVAYGPARSADSGNRNAFLIEHNGFYNMTTAGCSANQNASRIIYLDSGGSGTVVSENYFSLSSMVYASDTADQLLIEGNYFASGGSAVLLGAIDDARVVGNTFVKPVGGYGVYIDGGTSLTPDGNNGTTIEDNWFLDLGTAGYTHIFTIGEVSELVIEGNSFGGSATSTSFAITLGRTGTDTRFTSNTTITNNDFLDTQKLAFWNCRASGTRFQLNRIASPGPTVAADGTNAVRNGHASFCGTNGFAFTASFNSWGSSPTPVDTISPWITTVDPKLTAFTLDPAYAGQPGWWPLAHSTLTTLPAIEAPQQLSFDEPSIGSPTIGIQSASVGSTVTVGRISADDLPDVDTPFTVDGATLVNIAASAGVTGPFLVCLDGVAPSRLWHFEGGVWVDMTGRVLPPESALPPVPGKLCGMTATLSPFALAGPIPLPASTTTLDVAPALTEFGGVVDLTADVMGSAGDGAMGFIDPTGDVTFAYCVDASSTPLSCATPDGSIGSATLAGGTSGDGSSRATVSDWEAPAAGYYLIVAAYEGDAEYQPSDDTDALAVDPAAPTLIYTGTTYTTNGTAMLSAKILPSGCAGEVSFDLTPDPSGGDPAPLELSGGTATYALSGLDAGLYELVVAYMTSDANCDDTGVQDAAVLVAVAAGGAASGGGWYRDVDITPARATFGFVIQRTYSGRTKIPTGYRGQFLLLNNESWRLKAALTGTDIYGTFTCPDGVGVTGSGAVCASFTGSGMLQSWDPDLLGPGLGGWIDEEEVTFTATIYDGGQIKVCKGKRNCTVTDLADSFGIEIDGWPSSLVPETSPVLLVQPSGKGSIRASA